MKICICGSLTFIGEMKEIQKRLEKLGHMVLMPQSVIEGKNKDYSRVLKEKDFKRFTEFIGSRIKLHSHKIKQADAILILNYEKRGQPNYIGANTFLEMGFAFIAEKKIFTINKLPEDEKYDELVSLNPICINQNLSLIK